MAANKSFSIAVYGLLRNWWRADRVRISPREGLLYRLQPPCLLQVRSQTVTVRERRIDNSADTSWVIYACDSGACELRIQLADPGAAPTIYWFDDSGCVELTVDDLEVYETKRDPAHIAL